MEILSQNYTGARSLLRELTLTFDMTPPIDLTEPPLRSSEEGLRRNADSNIRLQMPGLETGGKHRNSSMLQPLSGLSKEKKKKERSLN